MKNITLSAFVFLAMSVVRLDGYPVVPEENTAPRPLHQYGPRMNGAASENEHLSTILESQSKNINHIITTLNKDFNRYVKSGDVRGQLHSMIQLRNAYKNKLLLIAHDSKFGNADEVKKAIKHLDDQIKMTAPRR